jgi:RNA polymerase sigma-70 factor (ECF subfamily)
MSILLREKFLLFQIRARKSPEAFAKVYDLYATAIYRFVAYKVSSTDIVEDITSETFLKAWQYLQSADKVDNIRALLYTVARNLVTDYYRKHARDKSVTLDEALQSETEVMVEASYDTTAHDVDVALDSAVVQKGLSTLHDSYREVLVLKYIDDLSTAEIGVILGKQPAAVRLLLHRALNALKRTLHHHDTQADHKPAPAVATVISR